MDENNNLKESKYEKTLFEGKIPCDDISIYPHKLAPGMIAYADNSMGEKKKCCYLKIRGIQTTTQDGMKPRPKQVVIELIMDRYHVEKITYNAIEHKDWKSQAKVFIDLNNFIEGLKKFIEDWEKLQQTLQKAELSNTSDENLNKSLADYM